MKRIIALLLIAVILIGIFTASSFAAEKKTGLYKEDGQWRYFENGKFTAATGLVQRPDNKTWHYVENGIYRKATGLVQCVQPGSSNGKWYYVERGDLNNTATGLVKCIQPGSSKGKWYYIEAGKINNDATGLVQCIQPGKSNGKWYYVVSGKANSNATGLVQCIQPGSSNGKWYYVEGGKLKKSTDLVQCIQPNSTSNGKWYYVKDGKLDKSFTGLVRNTNGDFCYIANGTWRKKTLLFHNTDGAYYYIQDGIIDYPKGDISKLGSNTGVLVSIEKQHLWFYKDGALILSTPIVTGYRNVSDTPKKTWYIYSKERDAWLRGPTWRNFVNYWLGIDTYGSFGIHDSSWRNTYGGSIYTYDGSHGCVNVPLKAIKILYSNIPMYSKVVTY